MDDAKLKEKFNEIYNTKIFPLLDGLEKERKIVHARSIKALWIVAFIFIAILIYGLITKGEAVISSSVVLGFCAEAYVYSLITTPFRKKLKKELLNKILTIFGDFRWYSSNIISYEEMKKTKLFPRSTDKCDDDSIAGTYKGIDIYISETSMTHEEGSGKSRRTVTDFAGVLIKIHMNKNFNGHTVVQEKHGKSFFNFGSGKLTKELQKVTLEDPEFEKLYNVYSNDQVEARYLLTTSFMERLKRVGIAFSSEGTQCVFLDGYVILALSTNKNLFETGFVDKTLLDKTIYEEVFYEMISILQLVQHFKLDQKLGL